MPSFVQDKLKQTMLPMLLILFNISFSMAVNGYPVWPQKFHAKAVVSDGTTVDLWYDYLRGRNLNLIHSEGKILYDNEFNNGSTYYYTKDGSCSVIDMGVGLLPPTWLSGATYLGQEEANGVLCEKWEKGDSDVRGKKFVTYWNSATGVPARWQFYTGRRFDIVLWTPNATLADEEWQLPEQCFQNRSTFQIREIEKI